MGRHLNNQAEKGRYPLPGTDLMESSLCRRFRHVEIWPLNAMDCRALVDCRSGLGVRRLPFGSTTFAATRYVSPTGKATFVAAGKIHVNSCSNPDRPCRTINWAVQRAQPGDTISVAGGTYIETITISKKLTIKGAGALNIGAGVQPPTLVDGNKQGVVFTIQSGVTADIQDMSIVNGKGGEQGGGILNLGTTLTLKGVIVGRNEAAGAGGGIFNKGALGLNRVWLYKNKATTGGGLFSDGTAILNEVNIHENEAAGEGGGIHASNLLQVQNSSITNNAGGGISINGTMTLLNVTISGNIDPVHTSGLSMGDGAATLRYVTITANGPSDKAVSGISEGPF